MFLSPPHGLSTVFSSQPSLCHFFIVFSCLICSFPPFQYSTVFLFHLNCFVVSVALLYSSHSSLLLISTLLFLAMHLFRFTLVFIFTASFFHRFASSSSTSRHSSRLCSCLHLTDCQQLSNHNHHSVTSSLSSAACAHHAVLICSFPPFQYSTVFLFHSNCFVVSVAL